MYRNCTTVFCLVHQAHRQMMHMVEAENGTSMQHITVILLAHSVLYNSDLYSLVMNRRRVPNYMIALCTLYIYVHRSTYTSTMIIIYEKKNKCNFAIIAVMTLAA